MGKFVSLVDRVCKLVTVISDTAESGRPGFCTVICNTCNTIQEKPRSGIVANSASCQKCAGKARKPSKDYSGVTHRFVRFISPVTPSRATVNNLWTAECLFNGPNCKRAFKVKPQAVFSGAQHSCGCYGRELSKQRADITKVAAKVTKETCSRGGKTTLTRHGAFAFVPKQCLRNNINEYLRKKRIEYDLDPTCPITDYYQRWRTLVFTQKLSRAVIRIDKRKCVLCSSMSNLRVHHLVTAKECFNKNNNDLMYDLDNVVTLCPACHLDAHSGNFHNPTSSEKLIALRTAISKRTTTLKQLHRFSEEAAFIRERLASNLETQHDRPKACS